MVGKHDIDRLKRLTSIVLPSPSKEELERYASHRGQLSYIHEPKSIVQTRFELVMAGFIAGVATTLIVNFIFFYFTGSDLLCLSPTG